MTRKTSYVQILELLRTIQRANRFISSAQGTNFSLIESHIAVELDSHIKLRAGELVQLLKLDKSTISRSLSSLSRKQLIEITVDQQDRRSSHAALSTAGKSVLAELDRSSNSSMARFCSSLTPDEQAELQNFLRALANTAQIPNSPQRSVDHPIRPEIRRITRAMGLLGTSVLGSALSSVQWHALSEVEARPAGITAQQLSAILGLAPNTISALIALLIKRRLLLRKQFQNDARKLNLLLSTNGHKALQDLRSSAENLFSRTFSSWDNQRFESTLEILRRFAAVNPPGTYQDGFRARKIEKTEELKHIRTFVMRELVRQAREEEANEVFIGSESEVWVLERNSQCFGAIEYQTDKSRRQIRALALTMQGAVSEEIHTGFLSFVENQLSTRDG